MIRCWNNIFSLFISYSSKSIQSHIYLFLHSNRLVASCYGCVLVHVCISGQIEPTKIRSDSKSVNIRKKASSCCRLLSSHAHIRDIVQSALVLESAVFHSLWCLFAVLPSRKDVSISKNYKKRLKTHTNTSHRNKGITDRIAAMNRISHQIVFRASVCDLKSNSDIEICWQKRFEKHGAP